LPPRRALANIVVPFAWINDQLISERKAGLTDYLNHLITIREFQDNKTLLQFLTSQLFDPAQLLDTPNNLPSMVSMNVLTPNKTKIEPDDPRLAPVAATYYPTWAAEDHPPEKLDFSKFDIIFFGKGCCFVSHHS
jgi:chitinase